jgi:hypothetical protein
LLHQKAVLLRNLRQPSDTASVRFSNVSAAGGDYFGKPHRGRGVAYGGRDNEGRVDAGLSPTNQPLALLPKVIATKSDWLGIALVAKGDATGATLMLTQGSTRRVQSINGGGSYLSHSDRRVLFALAPGSDFELKVRWPSGTEQSWGAAALGRTRYVVLREGEAKPQLP